jgi:hypothetical protein
VLARQAVELALGVVHQVEADERRLGRLAHGHHRDVLAGLDGGQRGPAGVQPAHVDRGVVLADERGQVLGDRLGDGAGVRAEQRLAVVAVLGPGRDQQLEPGEAALRGPGPGAGERGEPDELVAPPHGHRVHAAGLFEVPVPGQQPGGAGERGGRRRPEQQPVPRRL